MSTNPEARAWIRVRADALRNNLARIRAEIGPDVAIIPMVKADGYGLGVAGVVRALEADRPWGWGVATVPEGVELRGLGVAEPVIVLPPLPEGSLEEALAAGLDVSVSSLDAVDRLAAAGRGAGRLPRIHVDVDTGMGRTGFDWRAAERWLPRIVAASKSDVEWVGLFTHLHSADEGVDSVREQWSRFQDVLGRLPERPRGLLVHVLNSPGSFCAPDFAAMAVRPGIFLYGGEIGSGQPRPEAVASLHARVVHLREASEGTTLGYGATYRARGAERWATLSIGYGDGFPRALGNKGSALLRGVKVPIIGRISMDMTVVDISDVPGVRLGDVATLLGTDGRETITVDEVAELVGTISYEVLVGLTKRLPRVWTG